MTALTIPMGNQQMVIAPLTEPQMKALEEQIATDSKAFKRVGLALIQIREGKGYRLRGHKTFESYCAKVWDFTDRQGRRLIAAAETAEQVRAATGHEPASESVARVLAPVANDPIVLQKVTERLEKKNTDIAHASAETVATAVALATGKPRPEPKDKPRHPSIPAKSAAAAAPALGADEATKLGALITSARSYLANHPWHKADAAASAIIKQLDEAGAIAERLLTAALSRTGPRPAGKPAGKAESRDAGGPPRCPQCKEPIGPGDPYCGKCGAVL